MSWLALALELMEADDLSAVVVPDEGVGGQIGQNRQNTPETPDFVDFDNFGQGGPHPERPSWAGPRGLISGRPGGPEGAPARVVEDASGPYAGGIVGEWQRALADLPNDVAPCPAFRKWPAVLRVARRFADEHGETAAGLGWDSLELFGVHAVVGTIRADCAGAMMLSGGRPVTRVTADEIGLGHLTYRRRSWPKGVTVIPVWEFGR